MKSIRGKILLCMSLTVAVVLLVLGVTSVYLNYSSSTQLLKQTMTETAAVAAQRVSQELTAYTNVALDTGVTARLADPTVSVEDKQKIIDERTAMYGFQRGNIIGVDGVSILNGIDYSDREYFQEAIKGVPHVSEPLVSKITGELSIMIAAPLWENGTPNTKVVGVVYFVPKETFLNDIVSQIHVSKNGSAYAIDADGTTIADKTLETVTTENIEEQAQLDSSLRALAQLHVKMRQGESGFGAYQINGDKKFSAYAPIANTDGWSIAITAPQADFMDTTYLAVALTVVILVVSLIVAFLVAFRLASGIGNPIRLCAERLKKLGQGDLQSAIPQVTSKDETGLLAEATDSIVTTMQGIITDIDWGLSEMAAGNFEIESKAIDLYVGDFKPLIESMYKILQQLNTTLTQINQSAEQVASGSDQFSAGAQALSQGATEQASSVEELAATITEISDQVKETSQNAAEARNRSAEAGIKTTNCNQQMQEMIAAMGEISQKSTEIGRIIKTIEDIAFQTNILALNAAVEAARAGAAGKGFAVVADEVRNLASKSAEASKDTAALIAGAIKAIEGGTQIADETAESLLEVVESAQMVSSIIDKIAQAAAEQSASIQQITQGIDQISGVVQTNSATAEESAATSEELSGQAQMLKELIGQFKLRQATAMDVGHRSQ